MILAIDSNFRKLDVTLVPQGDVFHRTCSSACYNCSTVMHLELKSWEDGVPTKLQLESLDRWAIQAAQEVTLTCGETKVVIEQKPQMLSGKKMGVGAVSWDSSFVLASYLACSLERQAWVGRQVVELGAGVGMLGCLLAKWGAQVIMTDKQVVLPLLNANIAANQDAGTLHISAEALEWGAEGSQARIASLRRIPVDYIIAADCIYTDRDEAACQSSNHLKDFMHACFLLASEDTKCYLAFECRAHTLKKQFLEHATSAFSQVHLLPQHVVCAGFEADHVELYCLRGPRAH